MPKLKSPPIRQAAVVSVAAAPVVVPRRVGVMVDCTFAYGREVLRGISTYGLQAGWQFRRQAVWMGEPSPGVPHWEVDGMIMTAFTERSRASARKLRVPYVDVAGTHDDDAGAAVMPDNPEVGAMAAAHFIERGFAHLGVVSRPGAQWSEIRARAFARRAGDGRVNCVGFTEPNAGPNVGFPTPSKGLKEWLARLPVGTGVFCVDDSLAESVLDSLHQAGLRVPEDVAVLGVCNDMLIATLTTPALSSIDLNAVQIGYEGARMLDELMSGREPAPRKIYIAPLGVVVRRSTDLIAINDPDVSAAVNYIRDNATRPIAVSDVVGNVSLSRRPLEKRFRKLLGRSILEEIHRAHLERAKTMLVSTDLSVGQVAASSGFANATQFGVTFRRTLGLSPSAFRARHRVEGNA